MELISVIMPCYNASAYLREAIESVLSQSYNDWELIVVDDGSKDDSRDIAKEYVTSDKRVQLIEQPNSGACRARNNGIKHAKGKYVKFLDADDLLEPECLSEQIHQMGTLQANQIPFGDYYNVDENGKILSTYVFDRETDLQRDQEYFFFSEWRVLVSSPLHKRDFLYAVQGFDESLARGQEFDFHWRLAMAGVEFVYKPCFTFRYRAHNSSTRISNAIKQGSEKMQQWRIQHVIKSEQCLIEKYQSVPAKYNQYFTCAYFDFARDAYARGDKEEGSRCLRKAKQYGRFSPFQRGYYAMGQLIGFPQLEHLLRLRLKLIKNKK